MGDFIHPEFLEMINSLSHTITTQFPSTNTTNNNLTLGRWRADAIFDSNDALVTPFTSPPSTTTTTAFIPNIPATPAMPTNNNPMLANRVLGAMANIGASFATAHDITTFTPTNNNQNQMIGDNAVVNGFYPTSNNNIIHQQTPNHTFRPNPPSLINNYQDWNAPTSSTYTQQPMNSINPFNLQTTSLTEPGYGKLTKTPCQQRRRLHTRHDDKSLNISKHTQRQHSVDIYKCLNNNALTSSGKTEKRIYKMPLVAVNHDAWSWREYDQKTVQGSPYPRVYYKCNTSEQCPAKRRMEHDKSDPDFVTLKYTGYHCHPSPFMNSSAITNPADYGILTNNDNNHPTVNSEINNEDQLFEELAKNLIWE